jgi:hypothetical protein
VLRDGSDEIVVVTAVVDGELLCLEDEDGAIEIFEPGDPEVAEMVEAAREAFGPSARAMTVSEYKLARAEPAGTS